jgi:cytochrome bd-type quinol oxidase subunit 2
MEYMFPTRFWLDSNHFLLVVGVLAVGLVALLWEVKERLRDRGPKRSWLGRITRVELLISLPLACVAGALVFLKVPGFDWLTRFSYTAVDLAVALIVLGSLLSVLRHTCSTWYRSRKRDGQTRHNTI